MVYFLNWKERWRWMWFPLTPGEYTAGVGVEEWILTPMRMTAGRGKVAVAPTNASALGLMQAERLKEICLK